MPQGGLLSPLLSNICITSYAELEKKVIDSSDTLMTAAYSRRASV